MCKRELQIFDVYTYMCTNSNYFLNEKYHTNNLNLIFEINFTSVIFGYKTLHIFKILIQICNSQKSIHTMLNFTKFVCKS